MQHTYEIEIEGTPRTWNAFVGNRTNWKYYAYKKEIAKQVALAWRSQAVPLESSGPLQQVRLVYSLGYPTRRRSDIDSLCLKPHTDSLVQLGIIADDHKEIVQEVRITWEKSEKPYTKIIIQTL